MSSKLEICCEALMEAAWLAAVVTIPLFFNLSSSRMFESDKTYLLNALAVVSLAAWLLKRIQTRSGAADRAGNVEPRRRLFKLPLVLPVLALAAIYTLSAAFSILPAESWWGSYDRSQGTIVFYSYAILFLVILSEMHTSAQLRRLQYAFILTSLPVSAYAILQYLGADPIPWTDFIRGRSSGSMGNPIFLGAYLIMVIPLTFSRLVDAAGMLRTDAGRRGGWALAGCCGAALILDLFALLCTQSRGPFLGLAAAGYLCLFIFLVLRRTPGDGSIRGPAAAVILGCLAPALMLAELSLFAGLSASAAVVGLGGTVVLVGALYLFLWRVPWGKSWLWLTWLAQTAALLMVVVIGPARIVGHEIAHPTIGRWTKLSGNSVDVRLYLWQTGVDALRSGAPSPLPDGSNDAFHFLRTAIGYGPECIWFPVNLRATPDLTRIHAGNSDRMHNETFDNLIAIGFAGAVVYLLLIAVAISYSLQTMGLLSGARQKIFFAVFLSLGGGAGVLLPWFAGSPRMAGMGVQIGLLLGLFIYVGWRGFRSLPAASAGNSGQLLVLCLLSSLIAHFSETAVGISVTSTRMVFFILLAVLSVLISQRLRGEASAKKRNPKPLPLFRSPLPAYIAVASFAVLTMAWCFAINTTAERNTMKLFLDNWFFHPAQQPSGFGVPGSLILLMLTIGGGIALTYADQSNLHLSKRDAGRIWRVFFISVALVWAVMGILAAFFWAAMDPSTSVPMDTSIQSEARMTLFLSGMFVLLAATALTLVIADFQKYARASRTRCLSSCIGLLLAAGAFVVVFNVTLRPAWADIACHTARIYERAGNLPAAATIYERAARLAPRCTSYLISLSGVQSNQAAANWSGLEEAIDTLDHAAELNPFSPRIHQELGVRYMQIGDQSRNAAVRDAQLHKAIGFFEQVERLAPSDRDANNNLGRCYFLLGDAETAGKFYEKSQKMYPEYARTYLFVGEMQYRTNEWENALKSFEEAAYLEKDNLEARKNIGLMLTLLGRKEEAIREYLKALERAPQDVSVLRKLASLYFGTGNYSAGLLYARRAYDAEPAAEKPGFDEFLEALRNQAK